MLKEFFLFFFVFSFVSFPSLNFLVLSCVESVINFVLGDNGFLIYHLISLFLAIAADLCLKVFIFSGPFMSVFQYNYLLSVEGSEIKYRA